MKILVVEDNPILQKQLVRALRSHSYAVDASGDGEEGLHLIENNPYDLAIFDIMLPGISGLDLLKKVREESNTPIILLTARDSIKDRTEGLKHGADDYMTKPFELKELLSRVELLLQRSMYSLSQRSEHQ